MRPTAQVLTPGDWVNYDGGEHQVVALAGTSVRLRAATGGESIVLVSYLMASPGFGLVDGAPAPSVEPFGLLEGLPVQARESALLWRRHVEEVETGRAPGVDPDMPPRPEYDTATSTLAQLKYFAERLPATFIYAGIDVEAQGLFAGTRGRQIAGRFNVIPATAFAYGTTEQRDTWHSLIATLEGTLRLHDHQPGTLIALAEYLYRRSSGMIGSLSQLVRGAAILAIETGSEQITKDLLETVPVDYAAERTTTPRRTTTPAAANA